MYGRVTRPLLDFSERGLGTRLAASIATKSAACPETPSVTLVKVWF